MFPSARPTHNIAVSGVGRTAGLYNLATGKDAEKLELYGGTKHAPCHVSAILLCTGAD